MPIPNIHPAFRTLLQNANTSAGSRVGTEYQSGLPRIVFRRDGGPYRGINTEDTARMVVESWGNSKTEAYELALEVKEVLSPEEWPVGTYVGTVGGVAFSGGYEESAPRWVPDPDGDVPRYIQTFVMHYANAAA